MPIQNMPAALQNVIQTGFLEHTFRNGLSSGLGYRSIADREDVAINIGETVTKTRAGFKAPITTPMTPSLNTNIDNGITPSSFTVEQYTLTLNQYQDSIDLNIFTSQVGIANQFVRNASVNAMQAKQSLDRLARNALFAGVPTISGPAQGGYLGGNTKVRTTLGAPNVTIAVDDVRGFEVSLAAGRFGAVSVGAPVNVLVGSNTYILNSTTRDGSNVTSTLFAPGSTDLNGVSGTLTFSATVLVADATAGNAVVHSSAPTILRAGNRTTWAGLTTGDNLKAQTVANAVASLRNNTGLTNAIFNLYLDAQSMAQLFADTQFQYAYQGQYGTATLKEGEPFVLYGARFVLTTEAPLQVNGAFTIRRPMLVAPGALVEGDFSGMSNAAAAVLGSDPSLVTMADSVCMVTREPIDRLGQIVAQSWFWIGGFAVPTDATATQAIIPTANAAYLKRGLVIEHI